MEELMEKKDCPERGKPIKKFFINGRETSACLYWRMAKAEEDAFFCSGSYPFGVNDFTIWFFCIESIKRKFNFIDLYFINGKEVPKELWDKERECVRREQEIALVPLSVKLTLRLHHIKKEAK